MFNSIQWIRLNYNDYQPHDTIKIHPVLYLNITYIRNIIRLELLHGHYHEVKKYIRI